MLKFVNENKRAIFGAALVAVVGVASADTALDLAPINAAITTITSVGTAVFGVVVAVKTFKWIRGAL